MLSLQQSSAHGVRIDQRVNHEEWSIYVVILYNGHTAFSVFAEARKEDILKRTKLLSFYNNFEDVLKNCDEKLQQSLSRKTDIVKEIEQKRKNLEVEEYVVLVAGETSSGKSSLINLILGENILPCGTLPMTHTICEMRYGETRKVIAYYKDEQRQPEELILRDPTEGQSYTKQLHDYLGQDKNREERSRFEKCELFWPHDLLRNGIVIVDSPGIGEHHVLNRVVTDYLLKAFCFLYVINSDNGGGVQRDRVINLLECVRNQSLENFLCECAVFVCNKWDQIENKGTDAESRVRNYITERLENTWPNLKPQSQVVELSTTNAVESQNFGIISQQFIAVMNAVRTMMLKTIAARLKAEWRWLDTILSQTIFRTKLVIDSAMKDDLAKKLALAIEKLAKIKHEHNEGIKSLEEELETKTKDTVDKLFRHISSNVFITDITSWSEDQCPQLEKSWEETEKKIDQTIKQRFIEEIEKWETENHIIADARKSLFVKLTRQKNLLHMRIRSVEDYIVQDATPVQNTDETRSLGNWQKILIGVLSPIWAPMAIVFGLLSLPVISVIAIKNVVQTTGDKVSYKKDKPSYMAKKAEEFLHYCINRVIFHPFVLEQLQEININIENTKEEITEIIAANKLFLWKLIEESALTEKDARIYAHVCVNCSNIRGELSVFAIEDVWLSDISFKHLEWDERTLIDHGAFAYVFKARMITAEEESLNVAVKICKNVLTTQNASILLAEEQTLRILDHKNVVKFYGRALQHDDSGVKLVFAMELCAGNLRSFLSTQPECIPANLPENLADVVRAMVQRAKDIAMGLQYLHDLGIIHRDLKPEKILIGMDNCLKIADVAISKNVNEVTGMGVGTALYMAPEIFAAEIPDARSDIYSFGLILWEMWYGKVVFTEFGDISWKEFSKLIEKKHRRPTIYKEGVFPPIPVFESLMKYCWATDQLARLTADECVAELDAILTRQTS